LLYRGIESIHVNVYDFSIWNGFEHVTNLETF
jgi:hypothetical protein